MTSAGKGRRRLVPVDDVLPALVRAERAVWNQLVSGLQESEDYGVDGGNIGNHLIR